MKNIILILLTVSVAGVAWSEEVDPIPEAKRLIEKGDYLAGTSLLRNALESPGLKPELSASILTMLATYYEEDEGDITLAQMHWQRILTISLPLDHPAKQTARLRIAKIEENNTKFSEEVEYLREIRISTADAEEAEVRTDKLQEMIERSKDFPELGKLYYYLGSNQSIVGADGKAVKSFDKALEHLPALGRSLPVGSSRVISHHRHIKLTLRNVTLAVAIFIAAVGVYLNLFSKPWRWFQARHVVIALSVPVLYCLFSFTAWFIIDKTIEYPQPLGHFLLPIFLKRAVSDPGSMLLVKIFIYGLVGTIISVVFAVGTARMQPTGIRVSLNVLVAAVLSINLTILYYMNNCFDSVVIFRNGEMVPNPTGAQRPQISDNLYFFVAENQTEIPDDLNLLRGMLSENPSEALKNTILKEIERLEKLQPQE